MKKLIAIITTLLAVALLVSCVETPLEPEDQQSTDTQEYGTDSQIEDNSEELEKVLNEQLISEDETFTEIGDMI